MMKIGKYILWTVLFLLVAFIAGAVIYLYPSWRAARTLRDEMGLPHSSFEVEVELDEGELPEEQNKMFETLAKLTGIRKEAMYNLFIQGSAWEDKVHLTVCPAGETQALFEFYLSDETRLINETMLYNAVRGNIVGQFGLLEYLVPSQEETVYMTFEQVEQIFDTDLSELGGFRRLSETTEKISTWQYFLMLAVMSREKRPDGYEFGLETGELMLGFEVSGGKAGTTAKMRLQIENPSSELAKAQGRFPELAKWMPEDINGVKRLSITITKQSEGTIVIPTNLADQGTIDMISKIRSWIQETFGG